MGFRLIGVIRNHHFQSLLGNVISAFFNILSFALLVRTLPEATFGEWVFFQVTFNMLDQIRTGLLQSGLIKYYAGTNAYTARKVCGSAWYLAIAVTLAFLLINLLVLGIGWRYLSPDWQYFLRFLGIVLLLSLPFNFATWLLQAKHQFDKIVQIRILQNATFLILLTIMHFTGKSSLLMVTYAYAAAMLVTSAYCLAHRWTGIRSLYFKSIAEVKSLFVYGRMIVGSMVASTFIPYSDNFFIRTMINPTAVAIYSIPQKFMEVIEIILRSFAATAQPTLSSAANRNDPAAVARTFCKYTGAITFLILPFILGLILFIHPLIIILAGKEYLVALPIVVIFLSSAILYPMDRFVGVTLDMMNKPHLNFYKNLIKLSINVIGDVLFIWLFMDLRAVAAASLLNLVAGILFGYLCLKKQLDITVKDILKEGWTACMLILEKIPAKLQLVKK
ncbi:lipopolysaccharide biosynthesis protein [Chitinophaga sp. sic0106]|uniref:lipopolysaccharide biosynthesis protein n=1 Tax=Chitinophaga sp. sic0106 TaxID=2854785 RepID=UPI001C489F28|nr:oligosaccharide flippase family protein [Chitinophaga sp. sic0106]MBV7531994.1 oligosaccharide flippase family protein [Chitinophaga sp. sic0106]